MALSAPLAQLVNDNGTSNTDRITNDGLISVSGLDAGARWQYSRDFGRTWISGTGTSFVMGAGSYANGQIRVRQLDATNTASPVTIMNSMIIDTTAITVNMTADSTMLTLNNPTKTISLVLNDNAGTTLSPDDFTIVGGGQITMLSVSGTVRTAIYVPDPNNGGSTVTISIASNKFTDLAGNANVDGADANNTISFYVDVVPPAKANVTQIDTDTYIDNVKNKNEDSDNLTRDTNLVLTGTLDKALETGDVFDVSTDGGNTWTVLGTSLVMTGTTSWRYIDPTLRTSGTTEYMFRVRDLNGNATLTSRLVTFDTELPVLLNSAPILNSSFDTGVVGDNITTKNNFTFDSTQYSALDNKSTIALVQDINEDGKYQAGVDRILSTAVVDENAVWSLNTGNLAIGATNLGFIQWDVAGNLSALSATTRIQIVPADKFIYRATGGFNFASTTTTAQDVISTAGLGSGIDQNGNLIFAIRSNLLTQTSLNTVNVTQNTLTVNTDDISNTTVVDYNRDGFMDIISGASEYGNNVQQYWRGEANGTYTRLQITLSQPAAQGGIVAYDKEGDGFVDFVWGSWGDNGFYAATNNNGTLASDATSFAGIATKQVDRAASGVDIDNDGDIDLAFHTYSITGQTNQFALSILGNDGTGVFSVKQTVANVFNNLNDNAQDATSMTWADFDNDGDMDLFVGRSMTDAAVATDTSYIYQNQNGNITATGRKSMGDSLAGGASLAVDWDADGDMDIIELPNQGANANINLYTNTGSSNGSFNFGAATSLTTTAQTRVSGAAAVDIDWDGDLDLVYSVNAGTAAQSNLSNTLEVENTNQVTDGTSLHLRILDKNGINSLFGNTVNLYDQTGALVAARVLNAQSGVGTNDSTALVYFNGLNANQNYTAVLVRNVSGTAQDVGGVASINSVGIENINASWTGLVAGKATKNYVLTAEADTDTNNSVQAGTGYNDTFYGTAGNDTFRGAGGWNKSFSGTTGSTWSATQGMDVVDYKLATAGVTANLNTNTATGQGNDTFVGIEGLKGSNFADTFTDNSANNEFEGRGGNDTINLANGGRDSIIYDIYDKTQANGGNGFDTVNNFTVGDLASVANADVLDLRGLLKAYSGNVSVYWDTYNGRYELDQSAQGLLRFLNVTVQGSDTVIAVDINGAGNFANTIKLAGVQTSLADLIANNQITYAQSDYVTQPNYVFIERQTTTDTTPIVKGTLSQSLQIGEVLSVVINGKTYTTSNALKIDNVNKTWYVQVPNADVLPVGTYQVDAVVRNSSNQITAQDITKSELQVTATPALTFNTNLADSTDAANKAVAMTLGENGQWRFFVNGAVLDATATNISTLGNFNANALKGNEAGYFVGSATFMDFNRDGYMDIFGNDTYQNDGQQAFMYRGAGYTQPSVANNTNPAGNVGYYAFQVGSVGYTDNGARVDYSGTGDTSANVFATYAGIIGIDKNGDGLVDLVYGDYVPDDSETSGGKDSTIVLNTGSLVNGGSNGNFQKDPGLVFTAGTGTNTTYENTQAQPDKMISGVDLNNDGTVDLVYWATNDTNQISNTLSKTYTGTSNNASRLVVVSNDGSNSATVTQNWQVTQIVENVFFNMDNTTTYDGLSMTWADFNNDGYLDLFLASTAGGINNNTDTIANNPNNGWNSKIIFNDGTGKLSAITANATSGISTGLATGDQTKTYVFNDKMNGGGSVAVDWNADGKMDIIEIPFYAAQDIATGTAQNMLLYTRNGNALTTTSTNAYDQTTLVNIAGTAATSDAVRGLVTVDLDWDGDRDAVFFTGNAGETVVENKTTIATGTALHLRIVDQNGINSLMGNTVKLFNAQGQLVATQIINPQSGSQTNQSSAIIDFYGLNPNDRYSAVLLRNVNGVQQNVGGFTAVGDVAIQNVNTAWKNLKTGDATDAYVLTAEKEAVANDANVGNGIVGTGYNDTFFATLGADKFEGGGGSTTVSGTRQWSNTAGNDIVDYKLAGSAALTANLSLTTAQNTGFGTQSFSNIEGLKGASGNDTFTDSSADNSFEGRAGDDTYNLSNGGRDTLVFDVYSKTDARGAAGYDQVNNFTVGLYTSTSNADRIDLRGLLASYTGSMSVYFDTASGRYQLDQASQGLLQYLNLQVVGADTILSVDINGTGNFAQFLKLNGVQTTLADLIYNEEIIATGSNFYVEPAVVQINTKTTTDTTPIISGSLSNALQTGDVMTLSVNGKTYSSSNGGVLAVDNVNKTWSLQLPAADALPLGTYEITAQVRNSSNVVIAQDISQKELKVIADPGIGFNAQTTATTDTVNKATAMTLGENGQWRFFANGTMLDGDGTNLTSVGDFNSNTLKNNQAGNFVGSATFIDFDRDGDMDLFGSDNYLNDGQQAYENIGPGYVQPTVANNDASGNLVYLAFQVGSTSQTNTANRVQYSGTLATSAHTYSYYGGMVAFDKIGDGYADLVYGDSNPNDIIVAGERYTAIVQNSGNKLTDANTPNFQKDPALVATAGAGSYEDTQGQPDKMVSTVDLNNDGAVDLVYLGSVGTNKISNTATTTYTTTSNNANRLIVVSSDGTNSNVATANLQVTQIIENALANPAEAATYDGLSMTWADFNGDGYLDLFQGSTYGTATTGVGAANGYNSKIFFNDGTGKLAAIAPAAAPSGISSGFITNDQTKTYVFNDQSRGGGSVAVDWNADGKMDIIETPFFAGADIATGTAQNVLLFTRNANAFSASGTNAYDQTTLINMAGTAATADAIRGLVTADVDWDGDKDAIFFTGNAGNTLVTNTATIAQGTSLHLRILDQFGTNTLVGNTVQLYNSVGQLISTQVINAQSGNQTNDTSALVDFYGLSATERYTAVLLRNINGTTQNVGGISGVGTISVNNINSTWTALKTGSATDAYVLTAESDTANNNANRGSGIIGTGYNDTFYATLGNDEFEGSGGSSFESNTRQWSNTGGLDVVDFKLAANAALTINLALTSVQNTGFGTQSFSNIEGLKGASGNDTFTDSAADNSFEGRGGDDTINLSNGGRDSIIFDVYNKTDARGGNGFDTINNFFVGGYSANTNADRIDIRGLISGYTGTVNVYFDTNTGRYQLDQASQGVLQYLKIEAVGADTIISIDRNGTGSFSAIAKLTGVNTTLADLVRNEQIVFNESNYYEAPAVVYIDRQSTIDTTPIITGRVTTSLQSGDTLSLTLNGKTYSTSNGVVVLDPVNKTWALQLPTADALALGTYQINAVVKNAAGTVLAQDTTTNELQVNANPGIGFSARPQDTTDVLNKAVAATLGENGQWRFYANGTLFNGAGTSLSNIGNFSNNDLKGNQAGVNLGAATFIDFDRDGDMDLFGQDYYYQDGYQAYENISPSYVQNVIAPNGGSTGTAAGNAAGNIGYMAFQVGSTTYADTTLGARVLYSGSGNTSANGYLYYGGFAAFDKVGDGYADFIYGDSTPNDAQNAQGRDTQIVQNSGTKLTENTNPNFQKDPGLVNTAAAGSYESGQAQADKMVSSVDLNNDGAVDLVYWASTGSNKISNTTATTFTGTSTDPNRLIVVSNDGTNSNVVTSNLQVTQIIEKVMYSGMADSNAYDGLSMTWADFNNDGFLDLFMGSTFGSTSSTTSVVSSGTSIADATNQFNSKIFFNDGTGKLAGLAAATSGISAGFVNNDSTKTYVFNDAMNGGGSLAVDWNADGKMDLIETPFFTNAESTGNVLLYTRNNNSLTSSSNSTRAATSIYDQSTLFSISNTAATADAIRGLIAVDVDWDGDRDGIFFTGNAGTTFITNTNTVATGTSIHLRILGELGTNTLIGNTVRLYNSSGALVATQIINPQAGNQTSDTTGIVDFYGLNANETYTAALIRNVGGASQDVAGAASLGASGQVLFNVENVNAAWAGLKATAATDAYVLTAEAGNATNSSTSNGIIGTGYNDTFFATLGTDKFEGGGGSTFVSGTRSWSNVGGMDVVDYKLAGNAAITADLSNTAAQNTGFGTQTLSNIEGLKGASGNDTFTDSVADNNFEGRGGNDSFNLVNGGHDTLIYKLLDNTATGGNGADTVSNYFLGVYNANANADRIDLNDLITAYTGPTNATYVNGIATISSDSTAVNNYVSTQVLNGNTQVYVDLDGTGSAYSSTLLVTISNVQTDLATLLANQQLLV